MNPFARNIAPYVREEIRLSHLADSRGDHIDAFRHLETAHVLGQESTYWHITVHWHMLLWGIKHRNVREIWGQLVRIVGAAAFTAVKGVPVGNTGGSNVSPIKPMPISPALAEIIAKAKQNR